MTGIDRLNKAFESRVRLGIMSVLTAGDEADFNTLKSMLGVTDGNLASHLKSLEDMGFVVVSMKDDWKTIYGDNVIKTNSFHWLEDYADE